MRMMRMMSKRTALSVITFLLLLFAAIVVYKTARTTRQAGRFMRAVSELQLRSSTDADVRRVVEQYGGRVESKVCTSTECMYLFDFDNAWLRTLHLAPSVRLTSTLGVSGGVLVFRRVFITSGRGPAPFGAFVDETISSPDGVPQSFHVSPQAEATGLRWRIHVTLTPEASAEQRRIAYGVNVGCLRCLGGCDDAQELLPSIRWGGVAR